MLEVAPCLTWLDVLVDDLVKTQPPGRPQPGPARALSRSEVGTLALCAQWRRFAGERACSRWAGRHRRPHLPTRPDRTQFNRAVRAEHDRLVWVGQQVARWLDADACPYDRLDLTPVPVRHPKRGGAGWRAGQAVIGWSNRLGGYEGLTMRRATTPSGASSGYGLAPANTQAQTATETCLAARRFPQPRLPTVGRPARGQYLTDTGFEGQAARRRGWYGYGAVVVGPPHPTRQRGWSAPLQRWWSGLRQLVETVGDQLPNHLRLGAERPHHRRGLQARAAAKVALHHCCLWLNSQLGRPLLAFAELIAW